MSKIFGIAKPRNWEANLATALAADILLFVDEWMTQSAVTMAPVVYLLISIILLCDFMKSLRDEIQIIRFFKIGTY